VFVDQLIDILTVEDKLDHCRDFPRMNSHELGSATPETPSEIVRIFVAIRKKPKKGVSVLEGRTNVNHIFETRVSGRHRQDMRGTTSRRRKVSRPCDFGHTKEPETSDRSRLKKETAEPWANDTGLVFFWKWSIRICIGVWSSRGNYRCTLATGGTGQRPKKIPTGSETYLRSDEGMPTPQTDTELVASSSGGTRKCKLESPNGSCRKFQLKT
jgi:hypothetical protein